MDEIFTQWSSSLRPKQRKRSYQHFDKSLDLNNHQDFTLVKSVIKNLPAHQFLPFLKFTKKEIRYRKDEMGLARRTIKPRPIMYASHLDAHIYGFYSYIWGLTYEKYVSFNGSSESIIAYRKIADSETSKNKGNIQFAHEVFKYIQTQANCVVIVADISNFFDTLKHKILKERLCAVLGVDKLDNNEYKVFRSLAAFRYVLIDKTWDSMYSRFLHTVVKEVRKGKSLPESVYEFGKELIKKNKLEAGIPQGSPISGLLANIYLSEFDIVIRTAFPDALYRRYSDDIVLVCSTAVADEALRLLKSEIEKYALDINTKKAFLIKFERQSDGSLYCVDVRDGDKKIISRKYIDYLGFKFDGRTVTLRDKTLQRSYKKADKRILNNQLRQKDGYKHTSRKSVRKKNRSLYMSSAALAMASLGSKIILQKKKFEKFIRKSVRNYKNKLD